MSLGLLFDRTVSIVPMTAGAEDRYGNTPRSPGAPVAGVPCRRRQLTAQEDVQDRDQQARTFLYFFDPDVVITGRDRILDDGETLEVIGQPDLVGRRHRAHHLELRAALVEG